MSPLFPTDGNGNDESGEHSRPPLLADVNAASSSGEEEEAAEGTAASAATTYWREAPLVLFPPGSEPPPLSQPSPAPTPAAPAKPSSVAVTVARQVASNPVVLMTFLGVVTGAALQGRGLPPVVAKVCMHVLW